MTTASFHDLRRRSGMSQTQAARYLYCSERTIRSIEAGKEDKARAELFELKLKRDEVI